MKADTTLCDDVFLGLGSNVGDRESSLRRAVEELALHLDIDRVSSIYLTQPWGRKNQRDFYNIVCRGKTALEPLELLDRIILIEKKMGRVRGEKWAPRIIDIDILFFGGRIIEGSGLTAPHPLLHQRRFALTPLSEIAPEFRHPVLKDTIEGLLVKCGDESRVEIIGEWN